MVAKIQTSEVTERGSIANDNLQIAALLLAVAIVLIVGAPLIFAFTHTPLP
jgi:hypothetical protein